MTLKNKLWRRADPSYKSHPPSTASAAQRALDLAVANAQYVRDLGDLVLPDEIRRDARMIPGHVDRIKYISDRLSNFTTHQIPEFYQDGSVRFDVRVSWSPAGMLMNDLKLTGFCSTLSYAHHVDWVILLSPLCENCLQPRTVHTPGGKCLFAATDWREQRAGDNNFKEL